MTPSRRSRYLIKRWNMFQTSSEGDNPEVGRYVRIPEVREFGSTFWLVANFTWGGGTFQSSFSLFFFFKAGLFRDLFRTLWSRGLNRRPPTVG